MQHLRIPVLLQSICLHIYLCHRIAICTCMHCCARNDKLPSHVTEHLTHALKSVQSNRFMAYSQGQSMIVTAIILVGSINALSYNVVHYLMIQMTSAVTTTVLGEIKIIGLLVLSVLLLGELALTEAGCNFQQTLYTRPM